MACSDLIEFLFLLVTLLLRLYENCIFVTHIQNGIELLLSFHYVPTAVLGNLELAA
jgi:hypothetical protein